MKRTVTGQSAAWLTGLLLMGCTCTADRLPNLSSDAAHAVVVVLDTPYHATHNRGYGRVREFKNVGAGRPAPEENSTWYRLHIPAGTPGQSRLVLDLVPQRAADNYDFLLFAFDSAGGYAPFEEGTALPVRANLTASTAAAGATGLSCHGARAVELTADAYSLAQPVVAGETYLLLVDSPMAHDRGYALTFSLCPPPRPVADGFDFEPNTAAHPPAVARVVATGRAPRRYRSLPTRPGERHHAVGAQQTLYSIARWYGMSVDELRRRNHLPGNQIFVGQRLRVRDTEPDYDAPPVTTELFAAWPSAKTAGVVPDPMRNLLAANLAGGGRTVNLAAPAPPPPAAPPARVLQPRQKQYLRVNVYNARNSKPIATELTLVERETEKSVQQLEANRASEVVIPQRGTGNFRLLFRTFGYLPGDYDLVFNATAADTLTSDGQIYMKGDTLMVDKYLSRLRKGDVEAMYNVFFHSNAAILHVKSKFELSQLLLMLQESPNAQVRIHGHTNGNAAGKIITRGDDRENFFYVNAGTREGNGSARELSQERAAVIRDYLISNGIDGGRIEAKGWGGKKPIYGRRTQLAHKNARVEIEVISE